MGKFFSRLFFLTALVLSGFALADQNRTSLHGDLEGVEVIRLSPDSELEPAFLKKVCDFYVEHFALNYKTYVPLDASYSESMLMQDIQKDCQSDVDHIGLPNNYFYVAVDRGSQPTDPEVIRGLAVFDVLNKPGKVYLSSWLATPVRAKKGLGHQLLSFIFRDYPQISSLELIVARGNKNTVSIYNQWGFSSVSSLPLPGETYVQTPVQAMSIHGEPFLKFSEKILSNRPW